MKNKRAGYCEECGGLVKAGEGRVERKFDGHRDDFIWVVYHGDTSVCEGEIAAKKSKAECKKGIKSIINYIKEFGQEEQTAHYGNHIIIDERRGVNKTGDVVTVDDNGTLRVTSQAFIDQEMSYTFTLADDPECASFGNDNAAIVAALEALLKGEKINTSPFTI